MQASRRSCAYFSILAAGLLASQFGAAQAVPACQTTNALVIGTYGFVLNAGNFFTGVTTNPPGTTGAVTFQALAVNPPGTTGSTTFSNTELGRLLGGLAGSSVGAVAGQLYFDGNGNIFASSTVGGAPNTMVGTYTVNGDCTITISLNDAFSTATHTTPVSFTGFLVGSGTEIDLVLTSQLTSTTTTTGTTGTTTTTPGITSAIVQLIRIPSQQTCTASTLTGPYALVGTGFTSANVSTAFLARVQFDGNGKLIDATTTGVTTPLANLQYTGTYVVNPDCTGTLTLTQQPAATTPPVGGTGMTTGGTTTTTTTSKSITASFVITDPLVQVNSSGTVAFQSPFGLRPSFVFSLANQNQVISGIGKAQ